MTVFDTIAPRLKKLVLMLSSNQDGEVVAAARAIGRTLEQAGADWHALAGQLTAAPQPQPKKASHASDDTFTEWRSMRDFCLDHEHLLRDREIEFVTSLGDWRGTPTEKQLSWLAAIYDRVRRQTA